MRDPRSDPRSRPPEDPEDVPADAWARAVLVATPFVLAILIWWLLRIAG